MDFLDGKENPREGRVKGRGHACCGSTGHEQTLFSPLAMQDARDGLSGHSAELDRRTLSAHGEAGKREQRALTELSQDDAVPGHVHASHDLSVYLGNPTA